MTLGVVLMVVAVGIMSAMVMAGVSIFHLQFMTHLDSQQAARNRAQSALTDAVYQIMLDPTFGQEGQENRTRRPDPQENATSVVTFDPVVAAKEGVMLSCNNMPKNSDAMAPPAMSWPPPPLAPGAQAYGIPSNGVLVAARADVNGVTARAVAVVYFPIFGYALATTGPVSSHGPLLVAASSPAPPSEAVRDPKGSGSLASNCNDPKALVLNAGARVTGDVLSEGGIVVDPDATVQGSVEPYGKKVGLPTVDINSLDPLKQNMPNVSPVGDTLTSPKLSGFNRSNGPVKINGDLKMDDGVLFVKGDLRVTGGITGHGVVIVTGTTKADGGGDMNANATAALVSGGDISLSGSGSTSSAFNGLIYTQGNLNARNIALVGAFVGSGERSEVKLDTVTVVHIPDNSRVELNLSTTVTTSTYPASNSPVYMGGAGHTGDLVEVDWIKFTAPDGTPLYALSNVPDVPPVPLGQFWGKLEDYLRSKGFNDSNFGPNWYNIKQLKSTNDGQWYPVPHFLQYLKNNGPPPTPESKGGHQTTTSTSSGKYLFDLNRFITPADRMRVLLWRVE